MKFLFDELKWFHTFNSIKSECYNPSFHSSQQIDYKPYKDSHCVQIRRFLLGYLCKKCPTRMGKLLFLKVVRMGLSVFSVYHCKSTSKSCVISGDKSPTELVSFRLRTVKRRPVDGVIQLGETRYFTVTRAWFTCIQAMLVCSRLQRYIKHYAFKEIQQDLDFKSQLAFQRKINGAISYVIYMFCTLVTNTRERNKLTLLLEQ